MTAHAPVRSMTGFGTSETDAGGSRFRIELRSVNHRFLDIKIRLPRELQSLEPQVRSLVQARFNRGALDLKFERISSETHDSDSDLPLLEINESRARDVLRAYRELAQILGLGDSPTLREIAQFPEVIRSRSSEDADLQTAWKENLEPALQLVLARMLSMRETEGANLSRILLEAIGGLRESLGHIAKLRKTWEAEARRRISEKVALIFESHPLPVSAAGDSGAVVRQLLESRTSQELALVLDRTDIQEEVDRFGGHLTHFEKTLLEGSSVGRKLEFILQELGREINTLGNKSQDLGISEQVVAIKVRLEQLREQVLNLE